MITKYGFSSKLGPIVYGHDQGEVFLGRDISQGRNYSEGVASEIDNEIRSLIDRAYQQASDIIQTNMEKLELVAKYLIEFEKIDAQEFEQLMTLGYIEKEPEVVTTEEIEEPISESLDEVVSDEVVVEAANETLSDEVISEEIAEDDNNL